MQAEREDGAVNPSRRRRRRAVGPAGATPPGPEPRPEPREAPAQREDDDRLLQDRPPHHDRGV